MNVKDFSVNNGVLEFCANDDSSVIVIPKGVTTIGKGVFENFKCLKSVRMPNSVTHIDDWAFYICKNLESIRISNNIISIGVGAFAECVNLKGIVIPNGVKNIGEKAFAECSSLKKVSIPKSVETIGNEAFSDCYNLEAVFIPDSVKNICEGAFAGCEKLTIYYAGSETQWYKIANNDIVGIRTIFNSNKKAEDKAVIDESILDDLNEWDEIEMLSLTSPNKESANSYFEKAFHNTGKTLKSVVKIMQKAGYSKSDIVSAILSVLGDVTWIN